MALQEQEPEALNNRNRILYPALIIIVVLILIAATSSMRRGAMPIFAAPANRDTITSSISTNGKIEPLNGFEAHAPAPASVKKLFVKEGDAVKPGQMLVQLDDAQAQADAARALALLRSAQADFNAVQNGGTREEVFTNQAQLNQAKAELQAAERNLQAVQKLQQSGAASPAEVQGAEARLKNAQSQVNLLQQKTTDRYSSPERQRAEAALEQAKSAYSAAQDVLAKSNVRSPIAGTVYSLPVRTGTFVNGGDLLVQVANLTNVTVRAF